MRKKCINYFLNDKIKFGLVIVLTVIVAVLNVGVAYISYMIIEIAEKGTVKDVGIITIGIIAYLLILAVIDYSFNRYKANLIQNGMYELKKDLIEKIMSKNYLDFNKYSFSEYNSLFTNDLEMIENDYFQGILSLIYNSVCFILALGSMLYLNIYVTLWVIIMIIIVIKVPTLLTHQYQKITKEYANHNSVTQSSMKDVLFSYSFTRNVKSRSHLMNKNNSILKENTNIKKELTIFKKIIGIISYSSAWCMSLTTFSICAYFVIVNQMELAGVIAVAQLMNNLSNPLINISELYSSLKSLKPVKNKIENLLVNNQVDQESKEITFNNRIVIKDLSFGYENELIYKDLNLEFEKNKKYLILGDSGCGKSTLLKLISHYYEASKGNIYLDEKPIQSLSDSDLDSIMAYMSQEVYLIHDSIKNNITLLDNAYNESEINQIIHDCGLNKLIEQLPLGIHEIINENGMNLSGGEKQRIALARILIRKSQILLLDEFSSALDEKTAKEIEEILLSRENVTILNVSHKINSSNLTKYHKIIYIQKNGVQVLPANIETVNMIRNKK